MKNFKALIKMANKEMEKLVKFLEEHTGLWQGRNLKLYDIAWNSKLQEKWNLTDKQYNDLFNLYCEQEYSFFVEWMKESEIEDTRNYWGRTSTFDLCNNVIDFYIDSRRNTQIDYAETIRSIVEYYQNEYTEINYIFYDDKIELSLITEFCSKYKSKIHELKQDLEYIASGEMFNDFLELMQDSIEIDKYLNDFMENQVENFDNFIQHEIEENGFLEM